MYSQGGKRKSWHDLFKLIPPDELNLSGVVKHESACQQASDCKSKHRETLTLQNTSETCPGLQW